MHVSTADAAKIFAKLKMQPKPSTHHVAGWFVVDGKRVLAAHYSHGTKGMSGRVAHLFRKSLQVNPAEFTSLVKCPLSREGYVALLRERGVIA
jgi:hypothetical protein